MIPITAAKAIIEELQEKLEKEMKEEFHRMNSSKNMPTVTKKNTSKGCINTKKIMLFKPFIPKSDDF